MTAIPLKPQYGPTLGRLLAPRWHAAGRAARGAVIAVGIGFAALVVGGLFALWPATFSYSGAVPFHFSYRSLSRTAPGPGEYVRIERHSQHGQLEDSFAVSPLRLPPYTGGLSGELPVYASGYIRQLSGRFSDFALRGEGKTRVDKAPAYDIFYTASVAGREMFGRDLLLLPQRPGARDGVAIEMLASSTASSQVKSPLEVADTGVLERPLETFAFGKSLLGIG